MSKAVGRPTKFTIQIGSKLISFRKKRILVTGRPFIAPAAAKPSGLKRLQEHPWCQTGSPTILGMATLYTVWASRDRGSSTRRFVSERRKAPAAKRTENQPLLIPTNEPTMSKRE